MLKILRARSSAVTIREVVDAFDPPVPAYTTVATVMTRLLEKGMAAREGAGSGGYRFRASQNDEEYVTDQMMSALGRSANRSAALLNFAGNLDKDDIDLLREAFGQ